VSQTICEKFSLKLLFKHSREEIERNWDGKKICFQSDFLWIIGLERDWYINLFFVEK